MNLHNFFLFGRFQSTPPVKAATIFNVVNIIMHFISIHAAREGGDIGGIFRKICFKYFNPRRP